VSSFKIQKVKKLKEIADAIGCSTAQLAIAWCLMNPHVSSVILGVTSLQQLEANLQALEVKEKLTEDVLASIDQLFS
jgi:aryl-alcohol dehydrogenase-like predicted oxidoreductase